LYGNVWDMVGVAPWLGVGPAGFDDAWRVMRTGAGFTIAEHAHQELLQAIIEHGLLATGLALAAVGFVVRAAFRPATDGGRGLVRLQAGFAGALAVVMGASLYEFPLRAGALSTLAALCAGAILGLARPTARPEGHRGAVVLAGSTVGLVLVALLLHVGAWATDRGVFADADASILKGRQVQAAAGIDRGESWVKGGDPVALQQAARAFQDALWRRPVDRIALQELARVRYRQGRPEDAQRALLVATDIYPSLPWPWADLARVRRASGDDYGAWEAWSMALAYDLPADFDLRPWLVEALRGPGGVDVAALAALPPRGDRWVAAAQMVEKAGDIQEAEVLFREAISLSPTQRSSYAVALLRWGRPAKVLDLLPEDVAACGELLARAEALRRLARCEEALQLARRSLASCGAEDRSARLLVAQGRLCLGDDRAIGILEALVEEDPSNPAPRRSLAHELARLGRTKRALRQLVVLEKAGQLEPADRKLQSQLQR
ncbi:MAG: hypothetical protein GXP62_18905, partial [Oligoflexia bacterium]|nr:hypothetical protein [Oligoflexia bacterium]